MKTVYNFIIKAFLMFTVICCYSFNLRAATFTVTDNTWLNTPGSLLWSVNQANAIAGPHIIEFDPAGAPYTILATGPINLNQEIVIDGSTSGQLVELNGVGAVNTHGILIGTAGANSEIRGLFITNYTFHGVFILNSSNVTIGGDRNLNHGNVISGNGQTGIAVEGSFDNTIQGNYIGLDVAGTGVLANGQNGINIYGAASTNNIIGGDRTLGFGNVISGNVFNGVNISAGEYLIEGNYIGTSQDGTLAIGNEQNGLRITTPSLSNNLIGGNTIGLRNVISGNLQNGIFINDGTHSILGNYIGTNGNGDAALSNTQNGIVFASNTTNNVVGGNNATVRNIISGNLQNGIRIEVGTHIISGNYIGVDVTGIMAIGNSQNGLNFVSAGINNLVGGVTVGERNIISGNTEVGLRSDNTTDLMIFGNIIGLDVSGLNNLGNGLDGIYGSDSGNDHQIGGATANHRNIISGNGRDGIFYERSNTGLLVQNNYLGTDINGTAGVGGLGNGRNGVFVNIGTVSSTFSDNVISGNGLLFTMGQNNGNGIMAFDSPTNIITNNIIGLEVDGVTALGNQENGINLINSSDVSITGNTVSSNGSWQADATATTETPFAGLLPLGHGVILNNSSDAIINGNNIGVDVTGEGDYGNLQSGLVLLFGDNYTVGTSNATDRNIIGNNLEFGIHIILTGSNVTIQNNFIGQSTAGAPVGNDGGGIYVNSTSNVIIGGSLVNEPNVIANTTGDNLRFANGCGVCIDGDGSTAGIQSLVSNNSITCNVGLGIDLDKNGDMYDKWSTRFWPNGGTTVPTPGEGNIGKDVPTVDPYRTSSTIVTGTGEVGDEIQLFDNSCDCEGETYLTTTTVDPDGTWQATIAAVADSSFITAIAIDANNNTSEFTSCCRVQSDSLEAVSESICIGGIVILNLTFHVGTEFQLQSSSTATGPWADEGSAHVYEDSTWIFTPTSVGTTFYRIFSSSVSWGGTASSPATCNDSSEVVEITVGSTITADAPSNVEVCDSFELPVLTVGNYFTETNQGGLSLNAGDQIKVTDIIYVYAGAGTCTDENMFTVTINTSPTVTDLVDPVACDSYQLPVITGSNLTGNESYFTMTNGGGSEVTVGTAITSTTTLFIYDETQTTPNCISEEEVTITINTAPTVTDLVDPVACDSYQLPVITGSNLTGNESYFTMTNGGGSEVTVGTVITSTTTLFIYDETQTTPNCTSEEEVTITINTSPAVTDLVDPVACDSYQLPVITGSNLTGNESYFTMSNGGGSEVTVGTTITSTTTLFIYDETQTTPNCISEEEVTITINTSPTVTDLVDPVVCDSYQLPVITGSNLTGNESYFTLTNGGGSEVTAGTTITSTTTLFIYDETQTTPNCISEEEVTITINTSPTITDLVDPVACDSYQLPVITGSNLTGNESYFTMTNGGGSEVTVGTAITSTTTLFIYDETQTTPNCISEEEVTITINTSPAVTDLVDPVACDSYQLPIITGSDLTGNESYFTMTNGGGSEVTVGTAITSTTTLFIYDETQTTPNCISEEAVTITINTPTVITSTSVNPTVCAASDGSITITGLVSGSIYTWTYTDPDGMLVTGTGTATALGELLLSNTLKSGSYTNISVSLNGCSSNVISASLNDPNAPTIDAGMDQRACAGTSITLNATTTTAGATVTFDNSVSNGVSFTPAVGNVIYTATATLAGCTASDVVNVIIDAVPILNINTPATICSPNTIDLTDAIIVGGSTDLGIVTYWQDAAATMLYTTPAMATLGTYYIKSENMSNTSCSDIEAVVVSVDAQPLLNINPPAATCSPNTIDLTDPAITLGSTGSLSLSYWTDEDATLPYTDLAAETSSDGTYYIVTVNGVCSDTASVTVVVNATPAITSSKTDPTNCGVSDGTITLSGLVAGTSYNWSYIDPSSNPVSNTSLADLSGNILLSNSLAGGNYTDITVSVNSCASNVEMETLVTPGAPVISAVSPQGTTTCLGNDGEIEITATSLGSGILEYSLNGGAFQLSNVFSGLSANTYTASVRYTDGTCEELGAAGIVVDPAGTPFSLEGVAPTCDGALGKIYVDGSLDQLSNYSIRFIDNTNSVVNASLVSVDNRFEISPYEPGEYTSFILTDDKNCDSNNDTVIEIGAIIDTCTFDPVYAPNVFTPDGDGINESFVISGLERFSFSQVNVFNRWGGLVYSSFDYWSEPWDGGNYPESVYFFIVEYGESQEQLESKSGVVHLLR